MKGAQHPPTHPTWSTKQLCILSSGLQGEGGGGGGMELRGRVVYTGNACMNVRSALSAPLIIFVELAIS